MDAGNMNATPTTSSGLDTEYCSHSMNESLQQAAGMVVYSSQAEKIVSLVVIITMGIFTLIGQIPVTITIALSESLRTKPHFIVILMCCAADIYMVTAATLNYVWQYSYGCISILSCRIMSSVGLSVGLGIGNLIGYMALERAVYFCHPMRYESLFTPRKMAVGLSVVFIVSTSYVVSTEVAIGRGYHATVLGCQLPSSKLQTSIQFLLFILPASVITGVCMCKIWRLTRSCSLAPVTLNLAPSAAVQPATSKRAGSDGQNGETSGTNQAGNRSGDTRNGNAPEVNPIGPNCSQAPPASAAVLPSPGPTAGTPPQGIPSMQAKKAFRMIVLVSGAFWVTFLPAYVIRVIVFMSGRTWVDLDTRAFPTQALMLRSGNYAYTSISSLLNPLIYFYSRRDLRQEFLRLLGIRPNNVQPY